jgi:type II pantothenate kinase
MVRKVETGFPRFPGRSGSRKKMLHQSFDAAGAGAPGGGASWTGAGVCLGAAGFLAAASALVAAAAGRDAGAFAAGGDAGARGAGDAAGSGVMILTAGVDAAEGKSALVGFPVGIVGASAATGPGAEAAGVFQSGAYRAIKAS